MDVQYAQKPQHNQTLTLPDGRNLGFAEFGLATGHPVFFFHGWPGSRLEPCAIETIAKRRRLRIIAPERPGYGLSSFRPASSRSNREPFEPRRIIDWPSDVQCLADHLELQRFAVLGGSGGGPFALACAHALPPERMTAVGLMAPAGPWYVDMRDGERIDLTQEVQWAQRAISLAAAYFPSGLRAATNGSIGVSRWAVKLKPVTRRIDTWLEKVEKTGKSSPEGKPKDEDVPIPEQRQLLLRVGFEAFAQGSEGFVHDALLLSQPWGFSFEDVNYDKVQIWHGTQDKNAPIRQIRYMAEHLPHCDLREFSEVDHYALGTHLEEILEGLVPKKAV